MFPHRKAREFASIGFYFNHSTDTVGPPVLPVLGIARPPVLPVSEAEHTLLVLLASPLLPRREEPHIVTMTMTMTLDLERRC